LVATPTSRAIITPKLTSTITPRPKTKMTITSSPRPTSVYAHTWENNSKDSYLKIFSFDQAKVFLSQLFLKITSVFNGINTLFR
jgi:hypothetical protein